MGWRQRQHRGLPNGRVAPGRAPGSEIAAGPRPSAPSGCMKGLRSTPGLSIGTAAIAIVMAACRLILVSLRKSSASRGAPGWRGPRRFQPTSLRDDRRSAGQQDGQGSRSRRAGRPRDNDLLQLSDIHWQKNRTNNPLERIMKEIRRRTRVVGAFPDGQSCLNLAAARLRYIAGTTWSAKCYMNMRP
jgi:hypothetical protein